METASATAPTVAKISGSQISDNHSGYSGGGIYAVKGVGLTISSSVFSGNAATADDGGGICTYGANADKVNLSVSGSTITGNTAKFGGGIYAGDGNEYGMRRGVFSLTASRR